MRSCLVLTALTLSVALLSARADDAKKDDELSPKVLEILKQVGDLHKNAKTMHADASVVTNLEGENGKKEIKSEASYDFERPKSFALKTRLDGSADAGPDLVSDGKKVYIHAKKQKQYTEDGAADDMAAIGVMVLQLGTPNTGILFQNVLAENPYDALMEGVTKCTYAGKEKVNGEDTHHMKFEQPGMNWELWVAATGKPVVLKALSIREGDNGKAMTVETYKNWKIDEPAPKEAFSFKPSAELKKVEQIERSN
jgi:hypothetical protein